MKTTPNLENEDLEMANLWSEFALGEDLESLTPELTIDLPPEPQLENRLISTLKLHILAGTVPCFALLSYVSWSVIGSSNGFTLIGALLLSAVLTLPLRALVWPQTLKRPWFAVLGATALAGLWGVVAAQAASFATNKAVGPNNWRLNWDIPEFWLYRADELQTGLESYYQFPWLLGHFALAGTMVGLVALISKRSYWLDPKSPGTISRILALLFLAVLPLTTLIYGTYRSTLTPEMSSWVAETDKIRNELVRPPNSRIIRNRDIKDFAFALRAAENHSKKRVAEDLLKFTEYPFQLGHDVHILNVLHLLDRATNELPEDQVALSVRIAEVAVDHFYCHLAYRTIIWKVLPGLAADPLTDETLASTSEQLLSLVAKVQENQERSEFAVLDLLNPYYFRSDDDPSPRPLMVLGTEVAWSPTSMIVNQRTGDILKAYFKHNSEIADLALEERRLYLEEHLSNLRASKYNHEQAVLAKLLDNISLQISVFEAAELLVALRLYHREHGVWPDQLQQLSSSLTLTKDLSRWVWSVPNAEYGFADHANLYSLPRDGKPDFAWIVKP